MRVSIGPLERSRWLGPSTVIVCVRLTLEHDEDLIVRLYQLHDHIIVYRKPTYESVEREIIGECGHKHVVTEKVEIDNSIRLRHVYPNDSQWEFPTPIEVRAFMAELQEGFLKFKEVLVANGSLPERIEFDA